jgi:uncharacterized radical SAM superfamily protein
MYEMITSPAVETIQVDPALFLMRKHNFPDEVIFYTPGLKHFKTSEYDGQSITEFVSISVTGRACALNCEHCKTTALKGMIDLLRFDGSLFDLCRELVGRGTKGVLISGGSDRNGAVPLLKHVPDMIRVRDELGLTIRVHPGIPDEETCEALSQVDLDGVMLDIIGDRETIRDVYHLDCTPQDYEAVLERLERHNISIFPHIILGHYFGKMRGEWQALEMLLRHPPKSLVLVILTPLTGTPMMSVEPPPLSDIAAFFETARKALPSTPIIVGCARPMGQLKAEIDRVAIESGLNGIAYPAEGIVELAKLRGLKPRFINACCGVNW